MSRIGGRLAFLFSVVGVLVVLMGGWLVLVSPQRSKVDAVQAQIDDAQGKLASTKAYLANPANRQNVKELHRLQAMLPDDVRMSQVLRQLSAASAQSGVKIVSITPSAPAPFGSGQQIPVSLSVTGHYFNIAKFLQLLEARAQVKGDSAIGDGRLYSVNSLDFSAGGAAPGGSGQPALGATIDLDVYSYGGVAAPSTTATPSASSDSSTSTDTSTTGS